MIPTHPGWWWFKHQFDGHIECVDIDVNLWGILEAWTAGRDISCTLDEVGDGTWLGEAIPPEKE